MANKNTNDGTRRIAADLRTGTVSKAPAGQPGVHAVVCPRCRKVYTVMARPRRGAYGPNELTSCPACGQAAVALLSTDGMTLSILQAWGGDPHAGPMPGMKNVKGVDERR